jgi:hypothetical protein
VKKVEESAQKREAPRPPSSPHGKLIVVQYGYR